MTALRALRAALLGAATAVSIAGCETEDPTSARIENTYTDGAVYKAWWVTTLFDRPVAPGSTSAELRSVPDTGVAYALLAPGWDPESGTPPASLIVVRSKAPLVAGRGSTLRIQVSDALFEGQCSAKQQLTQADADFITERIFPGEFAKLHYDAATCKTTPLVSDELGADDAGP
jgi:hypothetical protein